MALVSSKNFDSTYTSKDGSIFIDFDAIDKMLNPTQEESPGFSDEYLNKIIEENMAAEEAGKGGTKR